MKRKRNPIVKILLLCGILLPNASRADTSYTVTNTTADAFLSASSPTLNFGGAGTLAIASSSSPKGALDSVIKFNLASAVSQFNSTYGVGSWHITGLTLHLSSNFGTAGAVPGGAFFTTITNGLFSVDWLANDSWVEGNGNGSGTAGFPGNSLVSYDSKSDLYLLGSSQVGTFGYAPPGNGVYTNFSLTLDSSLVADATAGGDVSLYFYAADNQISYLFNSRTFASGNPQFIVTAVPEPTVVSLVVVAAGGLLLRRKKT
jgi:hypothetical protein